MSQSIWPLGPIMEQLIFGDTPPDGYLRTFTENGILYKQALPRRRWDYWEFPTCEIQPCGGCGRYFSTKTLYSGWLPITPAAERARDFGPSSRVCRSCANRYDALYRRWSLYGDISRLINRLEREAANARRKARAA